MKTIKPCVKYDDEPKIGELLTTKIENVTTGTSRKIATFSSTFGIQELIFVIDNYNKIAARINLTVAEKWDYFEDILDPSALNRWTAQLATVNGTQKTNARFLQEQNTFIHSYTGADNPRDLLLEYVRKDSDCKKKRTHDNMTHASRIEALITLANRLQGTEAEQTTTDIKRLTFETFPESWRDDYAKADKNLANNTMSEMLSYMNTCKAQADKALEKEERKRKKQNKQQGNQKKNKGGENMCRLPGHNHPWKDCFNNSRNPNYKGPYMGGRGRGDQGRGGRGQQGRGNGGRGFSNSNSNSNNHYNNQGRNGYNQNGGRGNFQGGRGHDGGRGYQGGRGNNSYYQNDGYNRNNSADELGPKNDNFNNNQNYYNHGNSPDFYGSYHW